MIDDRDDQEVQHMVRDAMRADDPGPLADDLWPRMRERLAAPPPAPSLLDWAMVAAIAGAAAAFPHVMLGVLYNL